MVLAVAAAAFLALMSALPESGRTLAGDWPMWGFDAARSGMTPMPLPDDLHLQWVRQKPEPRRAWPHQMDDMDKLEFDLSYSPVVKGGRMFVASMATDSLTAYDAATGEELWRYYADGPMRIAPAAWGGKVYAVSDDGHLHCVNAESGALHWKFDARPADHRVLGNERVVSMWAARGGPVVKDGTVYFAAGVWPFMGTFVFALDAETGEKVWANTGHATEWQAQPHGGAYSFAGLAPQGYLVASGERLVVSGGRSRPVLFDRTTGALLNIFQRAKPHGGYRVRADDEYYYNHGLRYSLADGSGAGRGAIVNEALQERAQAFEDQLDADVFEYLAANGRLFVVSQKGTIYCFGPEEREATTHEYAPQAPAPRDNAAGQRAEEILRQGGNGEGYALFLGAGDGDLLEQIAVRSQLHVVALEPDEEKVAALRRRFDDAGLYGSRIAIIPGCPADAHYPKYISSLVVMEDPAVLGREPEADLLRAVYERVRPYDGVAWLQTTPDTRAAFAAALEAFEAETGRADVVDGVVLLARTGPVPGSGQWTHQYADPGQTTVSRDSLVRPPFGPTWFGGPTNDNLLPRHASGPRPQVAGGRTVLLGVETLSARCVFTGREMWVREFPGIGHPFTNLELEEQWREGGRVHMANIRRTGAKFIGSPYVSLPDAIYVRYQRRVFRLDPSTGDTVAEWRLPAPEGGDDRDAPDWGHISVHGDMLVTTADTHVFEDGHFGLHDDAWDGASSGQLIAMDRFTGEVAWTREAEIGFRHNAIASGNGRLFVNDLLSERALEMAARRGLEIGQSPRMYALDIRTGEVLWTKESTVFGTFLSYSEEHDVLLEGGFRAPLATLADEPMSQLVARRGRDGETLWERSGNVEGPAILLRDRIIPRIRGRRGQIGPALCLLTGEDKTRAHPVTGQESPRTFWKSYGCGGMNASEHLLFFRSAAAGFADLEHDGGTGTLGGFRAGCTVNLVAADGLLNAPDYSRTCSCSYQNQTSLGLVHMPEIEWWATNRPLTRLDGPLLRMGINLGAPGDRRAEDGTLWTPFPAIPAPSLHAPARIVPTGIDEAPVRVLSATTSAGDVGGYVHAIPKHTLDGDASTEWAVQSDRRRRFNDWVQYELSEPVALDRVEVAWSGPEGTEFTIQTRTDEGEWETVVSEASSGPGRDLRAYEFEPTEARRVRLVIGEHGDERQDSRGRQRMFWARVYQTRIGGLEHPEAYASFLRSDVFRKNSLFVDGTNGPNWVAASGARDVGLFELLGVNGDGQPYTVALHFSEPDGLRPGQRVFDIVMNGEVAAEAFDIVQAADGPDRAVVKTFPCVIVGESLRIELRQAPDSEHPPVLSGVKIVLEE